MPHARTLVVLLLLLLQLLSSAAHAQHRVDAARKTRTDQIRALFAEAKVVYPPREVFLRAFKREGELELWAGDGQGPLTRVRSYPVCAASGVLGPKSALGDLQVPEGFYEIDRFNPTSTFHLSLGLNYPNDSDRARVGTGRLGGDIFIHGNCVTIGCLPIEDGPIEELYLVALDARLAGQGRIPMHIFPSRLDDAGFQALVDHARPDAALRQFWEGLRPGFLAFEQTGLPPRVTVEPGTGRYRVRARAPKPTGRSTNQGSPPQSTRGAAREPEPAPVVGAGAARVASPGR